MRKEITLLLTALLISTAMASGSGITVSSQQVNMVPGKTGYLTLSLTNAGATPIYDVKIAFIGIDNPLSSTELCNACKLYSNARKACLEYQSDCYVNLGDLYSSNVKSRVYPISIPETVSDGYYIAKFQLELGSDTYIDYNVLINVSRVKTNFELIIKNLAVKTSGDLSIEVELANVGLTEAKGVKMTLNKDNVSVGNIDSSYIGDLAPGKFSKATFTFNAGQLPNRTLQSFRNGFNMTQGSVPPGNFNMTQPNVTFNGVKDLVFSVSYTNPAGDRLIENFTKQIDLSLLSTTTYSFSASTTRAIVGLDFSTVISYVFIACVIGLVVFFFLKSRRKKK